MIILKSTMTAGDNHPSYSTGQEMRANVFVNCSDWAEAESKAASRLSELGWVSYTFKDAVRLPEDVDLSSMKEQLREAVQLALNHGVALIVYPPSAA
jgi:hypothetical protein